MSLRDGWVTGDSKGAKGAYRSLRNEWEIGDRNCAKSVGIEVRRFRKYLSIFITFSGNQHRLLNCLSIFDHFVGLALKGLIFSLGLKISIFHIAEKLTRNKVTTAL